MKLATSAQGSRYGVPETRPFHVKRRHECCGRTFHPLRPFTAHGCDESVHPGKGIPGSCSEYSLRKCKRGEAVRATRPSAAATVVWGTWIGRQMFHVKRKHHPHRLRPQFYIPATRSFHVKHRSAAGQDRTGRTLTDESIHTWHQNRLKPPHQKRAEPACLGGKEVINGAVGESLTEFTENRNARR